ncbi:serine/threonine-protein kinase [Gloeothece verrucosa]|uniref:non-specific serine/threonine protein kinase n=1 Tax=Gloeothece verrucosa (strain PCC 7822) TaxID=497965 RepID=E0UFX3_GLOV7|nr:serine/threonine-protein kinase [Gloeothece verrucosa]ADN14356.1 serine/threonine protein kinase [Gloeothece verrucosa PCC 7822]
MEILCTRPGCPRPLNIFPELDDKSILTSTQQKYCTSCGMPLILGGHYMPFRLLGRGGFGAAFLACDRYTPSLRQCVVKQFQPSADLSEQALKKALDLFEREAMVLDTLGRRHEQIPELYAFFPLIVPNRLENKEEQFFYIVQEYIDGKNLEQELEEKGAFSEKEVLYVLKKMLKVLQFVHENPDHPSIHRDIKPSNIMRDRLSGRLYLLDFGAVKQVAVGAASANTQQPSGSTGIYSMGFAPPEQMKGAEVYPSTDLYALAVTCLMLLSGKPAHELYDSYNDCWNWRSHVPQISEQLAAVFERMLLPTPRDRYQSASDVLKALETTTIQPQPPTPPSPQPSPPPTPSPTPRRQFSLLEILGGAAFSGFEGSLLVIAFNSLLSTGGMILGLMLLGGLIFLQSRRIIEGKDLPIIAVITAVLIVALPFLRNNLPTPTVLIIAGFMTLVAVAITSLFRLIYQLLSR